MPPSDIFDRPTMNDSLEGALPPPHYHQNPFDRRVATKTSPLPHAPHPSGRRAKGSSPSLPKLQQQYHRKATLDLPLQYYKDRGLVFQPRPRLNLEMSFPVWSNRTNQLLECELSGISALRGRTGYCNGSAGLRFTNTNPARRRTTASLTASLGHPGVLDQDLFQGLQGATVQFGVQTTAPKSGTSLSTYCIFPKLFSDPSRCHLSFAADRRFHFPRIQHGPVRLGSQLSSFSIQNPCEFNFVASDAPVIASGIKRKRWELKFGMAMANNNNNSTGSQSSSALLPSMQLFLSPPQKSLSRILDLGFFWKVSSGWGLGGTWRYKQQHEKSTTNREFSVGALLNVSVRRMKSLSWVFSWTEGDCTLRIPILISQTASTAIDIYQLQALQFISISLLSRIIQDVMGTLLPPTSDKGAKLAPEQESLLVRHQKARRDALQQQKFMARQANIRMKAEKEKNGLVIERAVYYIRGEREAMNDDQNSLDVTVPIQFWVNDSTLHLFNVSKRSSMLGFFDLIKFSSSAAAASENSEMSSERPKPHATGLGWTDWMCSFLSDRSEKSSMDSRVRVDEAATAELTVTYSYAGITYEIAIGDGEEIILPNPRASRLPI